MIDSCIIGRRDEQVASHEGGTPRADTATVVLDMLCSAMHALTLGHAADQIICRQLGDALNADVAVTIALHPDRPDQVVCTWPDSPLATTIGDSLLRRGLQAGEEDFRVEYVADLGHVASMWIQPADPPGANGPGRLLAFVRTQPFTPGCRALLDRARDALVALWPHAARSVRAHDAQDWVRTAVATAHMTDRELQVLGLLAEGLLATSIASRLQLSPRTVHKHLGNIYRKLGVHDRLVAVSIARLQGLVDTYPSSPSSPGLQASG